MEIRNNNHSWFGENLTFKLTFKIFNFDKNLNDLFILPYLPSNL